MEEIEFFKPQNTLPVSVTGSICSLNCAHCGGHYLKSMTPIERAVDKAGAINADSCLISGGCDNKGKIPLIASHIEQIHQLKKSYKINMHVGMLDDNEIDRVAMIADVISLDIPVNEGVIHNVYGLDYHPERYIDLYKKLRERITVVPHICLGLTDYKNLNEEYALIEKLKEVKPEKLCYIIFTPTAGTRLEAKKPPAADDAAALICRTMEVLPRTAVYIGCMRPGGRYRDEIDTGAIEAGVKGIVMPSKKAVEKAWELGMKIIWKNECCAF